jgi:broad specificity phosphatase PhoE
MTTLILVRHGQTDSNVRDLLHGQSDVPLTSLGIAQAHAVAARLGQEPDIAALYTSPLERARHTAAIIGAVTGHAPLPHPGLMEIHFGDIEGLTWEEALERYPHLRPSGDDDDGSADLQWPNGESRYGFRDRVRRALTEILALHQGQKIVVVTHGGVIGRGVGALLGDASNSLNRYLVGNCTLTQLTWEASGAPPTLTCHDERSHLETVLSAEC